MRAERLSSKFEPCPGIVMGAENEGATQFRGFNLDSWLNIAIRIVLLPCRLFPDLQVTMIQRGAESTSRRVWNARTTER